MVVPVFLAFKASTSIGASLPAALKMLFLLQLSKLNPPTAWSTAGLFPAVSWMNSDIVD